MNNTEIPFFRSLSEEEKTQINHAARELAGRLGQWAAGYPLLRLNRVPPVAVLVAGVLPKLPADHALIVGKIILLIFAIDDVADERLCSLEEFREKGRRWVRILRGGPATGEADAGAADAEAADAGAADAGAAGARPVSGDCAGGAENAVPEGDSADDELGRLCREIRAEMAGLPLFPALIECWAERLAALCAAMAREYEYGLAYGQLGEAALPGWEEYLQGGIHSVGFPFWGTAILILLSEPSTLAQRAEIDEVILQTGAAIRLYNDLRTYEKEVGESNINAVTLVLRKLRGDDPGSPAGQTLARAMAAVRAEAGGYASRCCELAARLHSETGQFEAMIRRIVAFHAYFYGSEQHHQDYHTISPAESLALINGEGTS